MKKINVGLIRVITTDNKDILYAHEKKLIENFPNLNVITRCIPDQPEGIYDENTEKKAIPKIIELAIQFEKECADIVFISCAKDPALVELRQVLNIPVIGAGSSCAAFAVSISNKVGILMITQSAPKLMTNILGESLRCSIRPEKVYSTLDLLTQEGKTSALKATGMLIEAGCDTVVLACTGMSTIGLADTIKNEFKVKVIDPILASGFFMSCQGW